MPVSTLEDRYAGRRTRLSTFWWVCGINSKGRLFVLGPCTDQSSAYSRGHNECATAKHWEAKEMKYQSTGMATQVWKAEWSRRMGNIDIAFERARHKTVG